MFVLVLFFCSGATALVYEVLWSKYLSLMLGSTVQAQTVVLAVFMGGLALGNRLFGNRASRFPEPLAIYGYLEGVIGIYGFFFYRIFGAADGAFVTLGSGIADQPFLLLLLKLLISLLLLIIPTVLMGGTLPLLAAWIERQPGLDWTARVGIFYATNSLGAVTGAGIAGFYLVQNLGMNSSLEITGLVNVLIGLVAIVLSKREMVSLRPPPESHPSAVSAREAATARLPDQPAFRRSIGWFGILVAATGGISMGLEVLSARALAMLAGGSLQAFALVLMSFILGIGIGSIIISSSRAARRYGVFTLYVLLLGASLLVAMNVIFIEELAILYSQAKFGLALNANGFLWHQLMVALLSFVVLGLPAACLGAVVPLSIRLLEQGGSDLASDVGRLLTWNTLGAVAGVLLTGFVLMPLLGLRLALTTLALLLVLMAIGLAYQREDQKVLLASSALGLLMLVGVSSTGEAWRQVLSAGLFRLRNTTLTYEIVEKWRTGKPLVFYKDGADATVSVERSTSGPDAGQLTLRINGKSDASTHGDLSTQYLLAHLPMAAKPDAKEVFVLGFGSGITAGSLLGHPVERITIAENCRPVLAAAPWFGEFNRGVLTNSRAVIRREDARAVLKLSQQKYDIIISEPSNPWVAGVGSVFSQEFYQLAASRLAEGGIMAQWFHIYEMDDNIVFLVLRTFASVFPNLEIWDTQEGDIVMLGSKQPWISNPSQYQRIFERPEAAADLGRVGLKTAVSLWARQVASQRTAFAIPGDGPVQTDEFPILEYAAPRAFFIGGHAYNLFGYDERTIQFALAEPDKLKVLRALPAQALLAPMEYYNTSNQELKQYFKALGRDPTILPGLDPLMQVAFRSPESYPENPVVRNDVSEEYRTLTSLEADLLRDPQNWRAYLDKMEALLTDMLAQNKLTPDFSPAFFPAMGARYSIANKDYSRAMRFLRLGLVLAPEHPQLLFISRVLDRVIPPELISSFRGAASIGNPAAE